MRKLDLTNKKTMTKTNTKTKTMTKTNTFREHLQRAILETCDLWDIWSDWWGDMNWPKKRQWQRQWQRQRQWQKQIHLENTSTWLLYLCESGTRLPSCRWKGMTKTWQCGSKVYWPNSLYFVNRPFGLSDFSDLTPKPIAHPAYKQYLGYFRSWGFLSWY